MKSAVAHYIAQGFTIVSQDSARAVLTMLDENGDLCTITIDATGNAAQA
jgi:hypothetical protein